MDIVHLAREIWRRSSWQLLLYWLLLLGGLWLFAEFAEEIYEQDGFFFDEPVLTWFYAQQRPWLSYIMQAASLLGSVWIMTPVVLVITFVLWRRGNAAGFFITSMGGAVLLMLLTKGLLARVRPDLFPDAVTWQTESPSFPSGHSTGSMALLLSVYFLYRRSGKQHTGLLLALATFTFFTSISRLYLQVHYPSDIIAGWALGLVWVLGVNVFLVDNPRERYVLLKLPTELVRHYRQQALASDISEDDLVKEALHAHFNRSG